MLYTWARSDMMRADMQMKDADVGAQMWVRRCGCADVGAGVVCSSLDARRYSWSILSQLLLPELQLAVGFVDLRDMYNN